MRPLLLFLLIGPVVSPGVFTLPAAAASAQRVVLVVNAGSEPVYAVRAGHRQSGQWSDDLLGPADVIDVGDGERLRVKIGEACVYDVRAEYRDGHSEELDGLDLCRSRRIVLDH